MQDHDMIPASEFCRSHNLEVSFIYTLQQYGLVEVTTIEEVIYVPADQLAQVERMARMHADLGINMEGIDAIRHLLERIHDMQHEITVLRNKLKLYE